MALSESGRQHHQHHRHYPKKLATAEFFEWESSII